MPRFEVLPFKPDDYAAVAPVPWEGFDTWAAGAAYAGAGPAFTAWVDGVVAAVAGVMIMRPRVGYAWAVWGPRGFEHHGFVHRAVWRRYVAIIRAHRLHRVEAEVLDKFAVGQEWVRRLGMDYEWTKRKALPDGSDMQQWAWVAPD